MIDAKIQEIAEPLVGKDYCVFRMDSYSLSTSLVFENIDLKLSSLINLFQFFIVLSPNNHNLSVDQLLIKFQIFLSCLIATINL